MSVVKKPALCTAIPEHIHRDPVMPTKSAIVKSETTMNYLEQDWKNMFTQQNEREFRRSQILSSTSAQEMSQEERDHLLDQIEEQESIHLREARVPIKLSRFKAIRLIGVGGFAKVWLVQDSQDNQYYALKAIRKTDIVLTEQLDEVRTERDIYTLNNPWIVKMKCSFQDAERLYLVLEFIQGGDLLTYITKRVITTNLPLCKFYFAELVLAVHSVHQLGYLHLDLKPQNILVTAEGHIKLADFGVATNITNEGGRLAHVLNEVQDLLFETTVGPPIIPRPTQRTKIATVAYTAPEVLISGRLTTAADYWSLGIILYEMLLGYTPFAMASQTDTAKCIMNWETTLRFPPALLVHKEAVDLLSHILCDDSERYSFEDIIRHPFVRSFNFEYIDQNVPPIVPTITSPTDLRHFDVSAIDPSDPGQFPTFKLSETLSRFPFLGYTYRKGVFRMASNEVQL